MSRPNLSAEARAAFDRRERWRRTKLRLRVFVAPALGAFLALLCAVVLVVWAARFAARWP